MKDADEEGTRFRVFHGKKEAVINGISMNSSGQ